MSESKVNIVMMVMCSTPTKVLTNNTLHCIPISIFLHPVFLKQDDHTIDPIINKKKLSSKVNSIMRCVNRWVSWIEVKSSCTKIIGIYSGCCWMRSITIVTKYVITTITFCICCTPGRSNKSSSVWCPYLGCCASIGWDGSTPIRYILVCTIFHTKSCWILLGPIMASCAAGSRCPSASFTGKVTHWTRGHSW